MKIKMKNPGRFMNKDHKGILHYIYRVLLLENRSNMKNEHFVRIKTSQWRIEFSRNYRTWFTEVLSIAIEHEWVWFARSSYWPPGDCRIQKARKASHLGAVPFWAVPLEDNQEEVWLRRIRQNTRIVHYRMFGISLNTCEFVNRPRTQTFVSSAMISKAIYVPFKALEA